MLYWLRTNKLEHGKRKTTRRIFQVAVRAEQIITTKVKVKRKVTHIVGGTKLLFIETMINHMLKGQRLPTINNRM